MERGDVLRVGSIRIVYGFNVDCEGRVKDGAKALA